PPRAQGQSPQAGDPPLDRRRPRGRGQRAGGVAGRGGPALARGLAGDRADDPRGPGRDRLAGGSSVERALGLMAGAGVLPGRAAAEATRQGWRVVAFAFEDAPGLAEHADLVIPSRIDQIQAVLRELTARRVSAALFVGKF